MKVAQINYVFDPALTDPDALLDRYGTLTGWGQALLEAGADRVVTFQRFSRDASFTRHGVEYVFRRDGAGSRPGAWSLLRRLNEAVRDVDPDIAHVNGLEWTVPVWFLRHILNTRTALVLQDHGGASPRLGRTAMLRTYGHRCVDGYLFTSAAQAKPWVKTGVIRARPEHATDEATTPLVLAVLEASTHLVALPRVEARRTTGIVGDPALLWVGRLDANKDPLTVLEGFEQSLAHLPDATLTMVFGEDALLSSVRARIQRNDDRSRDAADAGPGLRERVRLVGRVPHEHMAAYYSAADIFVLGSHHEGSGYALIEACACGAVPVVTDIPSFGAITGRRIGQLWPTGDADAFTRALIEVAARSLATEREAVTRHFERALSWTAVGRAALHAYARVLAARSQRRPAVSA